MDASGVITHRGGCGRVRVQRGRRPGGCGPGLNGPSGVAVDGAGNLYIADTGIRRIRKVDAAGTITTIAGTGEFVFSGDGGPAIQAALNRPSGVAVDGAGNLFIADVGNNRIRKVDASGVISIRGGH